MSEITVHIHPFFDMYQEDYKSRKVHISYNGSDIAVISSTNLEGWGIPTLVLLKGSFTTDSWVLIKIHQIYNIISKVLNKSDLDYDSLYEIIEEINNAEPN